MILRPCRSKQDALGSFMLSRLAFCGFPRGERALPGILEGSGEKCLRQLGGHGLSALDPWLCVIAFRRFCRFGLFVCYRCLKASIERLGLLLQFTFVKKKAFRIFHPKGAL
jgi:hypothetical protein